MKIVNKTGYLKGAKTAKNPVNIIPSSLITTQGMAFPIKANGKTLYPNTGQYKFPTSHVVETPLKQKGVKNTKTIDNFRNKLSPDKQKEYDEYLQATKKGLSSEGLFDLGMGVAGEGIFNSAVKAGSKLYKTASPYVKPVISKAAKPIIDKAAPVVNKVTSSIKNIPTYLNNAATLADESLGRIFRNKGNKKAIDEGNQWLENWIKHPKTQAKIDADMDAALVAKNKVFDPDIELLRKQSKQHKPSIKEYPLRQQLKDLAKGKEHIHEGNAGVSYTHGFNPYWKEEIAKGKYTPNVRYGEWMSRNPLLSQRSRTSTTIHEGTHGWASSDALKTSGMRNKVLKEMPADAKKNFLEWQALNAKNIDPATVMGKQKAYEGYIADPTEMHARIMETRKHFNLTPDDVIDEDKARNMMIKLMEMPSRKRPVDIHAMSKTIGDSPKALANLMNKMWAVPAVGVAGASVAAQEKKNGTKLIKYKNGSKSVSLAFSRGEKDPKGGLTQKGVDKYNRATGGNLKMAVTTPPSKLKAGSKPANRRKSFCARMSGVKGPMKKPNGEPSRKALALRKWNC